MRKLAYAVVGLGVLIAGAAAMLLWGQARPAVKAASGPPIVSADATDAPAPVNNPDQTLVQSSEPTALDEAAAVEKATAAWGTGFMATGKAIVVGKYRFTDGNLPATIVPQNALVWIVSVDGIVSPTMASPAGSKTRLIAHQMNFVVDGDSGAVLVIYAGQVSQETSADAAALAAATPFPGKVMPPRQ